MFCRKSRKERLLEKGYKESRNPSVVYKKVERNGAAAVHFINVATGEEWEKVLGKSGKAPLHDIEVPERVNKAAKLYLQCLAAVERDFPELSREDMHKVASVLYKGLCQRGEEP